MWPFKQKKNKPTELKTSVGLVMLYGTYTLGGNPFDPPVRVIEVKNSVDGTPWVKYSFGGAGTLNNTLSKFLSMYQYIE